MNKLDGIWRRIQGSLFPRLDDVLSSPMTDDHKKVAKILEIVRAEEGVVDPADIPALDLYTRMSPGEIAKSIPQGCDWGGKKNSQGNVEWWRGFKIHIHSASVHDSPPVPYLVRSRSIKAKISKLERLARS